MRKQALKTNKIAIKLKIKNDGAIAQLVEQRTENPCVPGSIPGGTTDNKAVTSKGNCFFYVFSGGFIYSPSKVTTK